MHWPVIDLRDLKSLLDYLVGYEKQTEIDEDLVGRRGDQSDGNDLHRFEEVAVEP